MSDRFRDALTGAWKRIEERQWIYGRMGRVNPSGSVTFQVPGRKGFVYVRLRNAIGAQTTVPARNDGAVPHTANLPVRMKLEKGVYVIHSRTSRIDMNEEPDTPASGVWPHATTHEFGGTDEIDIATLVDGASEQVALEDTNAFPLTDTGILKWASWTTIKNALTTLFDGLYVALDGSTPLTGDWDIGEDRAIKLERIQARDAEGINFYNSSGVLHADLADNGKLTAAALDLINNGGAGIYIEDTGDNSVIYALRIMNFEGMDFIARLGSGINPILGLTFNEDTENFADFYRSSKLAYFYGPVTSVGLLTASSGITFGEDTLANYDQGTWTPAITGSSSNPTVTYTTRTGRYTRIGDVVHFSIEIIIATISGGSGNAHISLPITCGRVGIATCFTEGVNLPGTPATVIFTPRPTVSYGFIMSTQDDGASGVVAVSALAAGDLIYVDGCYFV